MSNPDGAAPDKQTSAPRRWAAGAWKAAIALVIGLAVVYAPLRAAATRYRIVYDSVEGPGCLPYSVFLLDLKDHAVGRGTYVVFYTTTLGPFYHADPEELRSLQRERGQSVVVDRRGVMIDGVYRGVAAVKQIAGIPGDHVAVTPDGVRINGKYMGSLQHAQEGGKLWRMGRRMSEFLRDESVPVGHLWMMGTGRSYDSRYWGYVSNEQILGRAIPLW